MAKRFTETKKWEDDWYLSLSNDNRIIYQWLIDNCDHAGMIKKNLKMMNYCCHANIDHNGLMEIFKDKIYDCDTFYFIPNFIKHQYPAGLASEKPVVKSVRKLLIQNDSYPVIKSFIDKHKLMIEQSLHNRSKTIKDKDKDKDMDKDKVKEEEKKNTINSNTLAKKLKPSDIVELWNEMAHKNLQRVKFLNDARERHLKTRLRNIDEIEMWEEIFTKVNKSDFLIGKATHWKCGFDWVINSSNMTKILEGNYDNKRKGFGSTYPEKHVLERHEREVDKVPPVLGRVEPTPPKA